MKRSRIVTRQEVAAAAEVSPYTVSVALNEPAYGRVSPEVRERVRAVAARLGYQPRAAGRALRLGRTELIAYVTSPQLLHTVSTYHGALLPALLNAVNEAGYDLAIVGSDSPACVYERLQRAVQAGKYDGIILGRPRSDEPLASLLREAHTPFVLAGSHPDATLYQVRRDDAGVASDAAGRLLGLGHRRLGWMGRDHNAELYHYARIRRQTLRDAARAAGGFAIDLSADAREATREIQRHRVTAVVTEDDGLAMELIRAAQEASMDVPDDLAVVSLYGVRAPLSCRPSLASFCVDPSDTAREAVHLLSRLIDGESPEARQVLLPTWYVGGESLARSPEAPAREAAPAGPIRATQTA